MNATLTNFSQYYQLNCYPDRSWLHLRVRRGAVPLQRHGHQPGAARPATAEAAPEIRHVLPRKPAKLQVHSHSVKEHVGYIDTLRARGEVSTSAYSDIGIDRNCHCTAVSSEAWAKLREWAILAATLGQRCPCLTQSRCM